MNTARSKHSCTRLRNDSIIVVGGDYGSVDSTEILTIGELNWKYGPVLKEGLRSDKVVESNRKDYIAYNFGGHSKIHSSEIYGLNVERNEWQLVANMNERRCCGTAVNVPSNLIPWSEV